MLTDALNYFLGGNWTSQAAELPDGIHVIYGIGLCKGFESACRLRRSSIWKVRYGDRSHPSMKHKHEQIMRLALNSGKRVFVVDNPWDNDLIIFPWFRCWRVNTWGNLTAIPTVATTGDADIDAAQEYFITKRDRLRAKIDNLTV